MQSTHVDRDRAGPSDLPSFPDTLRSRLQSASMKYYSPNPLKLLTNGTEACSSYLHVCIRFEPSTMAGTRIL
jgi:hypothetical protein